MAGGERSIRVFDDESPYVDRFGLLLLVTIASVVTLSLVDGDQVFSDLSDQLSSLGTTVLVGGTLLLALRASGVSRRWWRIALALILVIVLVTTLVAVMRATGVLDLPEAVSGAPPIALVILSTMAPLVVVRRLLRHRTVSVGTLQGAIAAYLLLPIAFFYVFQWIGAHSASPFFGRPEPTTSFMYFSLSTITTLGYGDLGAASDLGRLLATSEAIIGQIYLVTFVGMIVGLFAAGRTAGPPDDDSETRR